MNPFGFTQDQWLDIGISAFIVFATLLLGRWLINLILNRLVKRLTSATKTTLDDVIIDAIRPPLHWLVVVLALQLSLERLAFIETLGELELADLYFVLYLLLVFILLWRLISRISQWYLREIAPTTETNLDLQVVPFISRISLILLAIIAAIMLLSRFEVEIGGLVATLGIGSLAIALAAQAALSDTISSILIMVDRPFRIGDRIEIQDLDTWGDVVDIGMRSSRIRTRDNRMVIVPNSIIAKSMVVNYSYPDTQYRIQIEVGVAYGTNLEHARQTIIDAVRDVEGVLPDHPVEALFLQFGDSALIFRVRWWLESYIDTRRMFDRVNTAIYNALEAAGIEMPFPQQDVHHKIDPADAGQIAQILGPSQSRQS